jgi:hypothetical protein
MHFLCFLIKKNCERKKRQSFFFRKFWKKIKKMMGLGKAIEEEVSYNFWKGAIIGYVSGGLSVGVIVLIVLKVNNKL